MEKEKQEIHHEDLALKTAAQYFGEELMPLMGISGAIALIGPTESVKLEARQMYQDFNYVMADNGWVHLEFESDSITLEDLRRFREYEAATSREMCIRDRAWAVMASEIGVTPSRPKAVTNRDWNPFNAPCAAEEPIPKIRKPTMVLMVPAITFSAGFLWISRPTMAMSPIRSDASPKMS